MALKHSFIYPDHNTKAKDNEKELGGIIQEFLKRFNLNEKLYEQTISNDWATIVGKTIAKHTTSLNVYKQKIYISLNAPALKEEMMYSKENLRQHINDFLGQNYIQEVIIK